jgi:hypothetical protein
MDTPLSETAVAGACVGAAMAGYRPVADLMFADFVYVAGNEIFVNAAKWRFMHGGNVSLPLVIIAAMGGGARLGPEHSQSPRVHRHARRDSACGALHAARCQRACSRPPSGQQPRHLLLHSGSSGCGRGAGGGIHDPVRSGGREERART